MFCSPACCHRRPYPDIPDYLPQAGLEHGSEHYVLGPLALAQVFPVNGRIPRDWIGFDSGAEGIVARYHLPGQPKEEARPPCRWCSTPPSISASEQYAAPVQERFALNTQIGVGAAASPGPSTRPPPSPS